MGELKAVMSGNGKGIGFLGMLEPDVRACLVVNKKPSFEQGP